MYSYTKPNKDNIENFASSANIFLPKNSQLSDPANAWKNIKALSLKDDGTTNYISTENCDITLAGGIVKGPFYTIYAQLWNIMNKVQPKDVNGNGPNTGSTNLKTSTGGFKADNTELLKSFKQVLEPATDLVPSVLNSEIQSQITIKDSTLGFGIIDAYANLKQADKNSLMSFMQKNITMVKQELMNYNCALLQKNSNYNFKVTNFQLENYLKYVNQLVFPHPDYTWVNIPDSLLTNEIYLMYCAWYLAKR